MCYSQVINYYSHNNVQLYFFSKEQEINAQNSINNGTRTEGGLPVEGVKQISFAHGPSYNIFPVSYTHLTLPTKRIV